MEQEVVPQKKKKAWYKRKWIWAIGVAVVVVLFLFQSGGGVVPEFSSVSVEKVDLVQSVRETGSVVPTLEVAYGFEVSGKVVEINNEIGDQIKEGDVVARLENAKQQSRLQEAYSLLASAQARLNLELAGPSDEKKNESLANIDQAKAALVQQEANLEKVKAASQLSIDNAQKALETAQNDLQLSEGGENSKIVNDAYADLVVELKAAITSMSSALAETDNFLGVDNTSGNDDIEPAILAHQTDQYNVTKQKYTQARAKKNAAEALVLPLTTASLHDDVDVAQIAVDMAIFEVQLLLSQSHTLLEGLEPGFGLTQSNLESLKTAVTTEQTAVNKASTAVLTAVQAVSTARNSLFSFQIAYDKANLVLINTKSQAASDISVAEAQLLAKEAALKQAEAAHASLIADPREVDLGSFRADVARQAANVAALQDDVKKTELTALADGVLSVLDIELGETVSPSETVATIISPQLTVEVDVSESDIAKVEVDDPAEITLDAFGDDFLFTGTVVSIEPAETEISGVIYYKTKIVLDAENEEQDVRPGMTANIQILTDKKEGALIVPQRAILDGEDGPIVRVLTDEKTGAFEERAVVLGLRGDDGQREIVEGLSEGEEVITFIKE